MKLRQLGSSTATISRIGLGAWSFGGGGEFGWGPQDDEVSLATMLHGFEHGLNWVDTAPIYGFGRSEEVVGRALRAWQGARPYVFTKCALRWDDAHKIRHDYSAASIREECETSLRRLQSDVIDLYQMHFPPQDDGPELEEGWQVMADLQREGKVRWLGASNFTAEQLRRVTPIATPSALQPPYSLLKRHIERGILPYCVDHGVGVIVYSPLASGLLTGGMTRERVAALPEDDFRKRNPDFREPRLSKNLERQDRVRAVARRLGIEPAAVAVAWTLRHPAVTGAIVGARNQRQLHTWLPAENLALSEEDCAELEATAPAAGART